MTKSILNDVLLIKDEPLETIENYFKSININTFDVIISKEQPVREKIQTILFILCAYSEDSPMVILRQDSKQEKEQICEYLQIPEYMHGSLLNFADQDIRKTVTSYLYQFAGEMFRNLMFMKIQYEDFDRDITNREFTTKEPVNEDGNIIVTYDIKEHGKAIAEKERLAKAIYKLESEIKQQSKSMLGIEDMKTWKDKGKGKKVIVGRGMQMENSQYIK